MLSKYVTVNVTVQLENNRHLIHNMSRNKYAMRGRKIIKQMFKL